MMQEKLAGKELALEKETLKEARSAEEIREIIQTIESYLIRTKETIERVEKYVQELKQEKIKESVKEEEEGAKTIDPEEPGRTL